MRCGHTDTNIYSIAGFEDTSSHITLRINQSTGEVHQMFSGSAKANEWAHDIFRHHIKSLIMLT